MRVEAGSIRGKQMINESADARGWIGMFRAWKQTSNGAPILVFEKDYVWISGHGDGTVFGDITVSNEAPVADVLVAIEARWPLRVAPKEEAPEGFRGEALRQYKEAEAYAAATYKQLDEIRAGLLWTRDRWLASTPGGYGAAGMEVSRFADAYARATFAVSKIAPRFLRPATVEPPCFPFLATNKPQMSTSPQAIGDIRAWLQGFGITPPERWKCYADGENMTYAQWNDLDNLGV